MSETIFLVVSIGLLLLSLLNFVMIFQLNHSLNFLIKRFGGGLL